MPSKMNEKSPFKMKTLANPLHRHKSIDDGIDRPQSSPYGSEEITLAGMSAAAPIRCVTHLAPSANPICQYFSTRQACPARYLIALQGLK